MIDLTPTELTVLRKVAPTETSVGQIYARIAISIHYRHVQEILERLRAAGTIEKARWGFYRLTEQGAAVLALNPIAVVAPKPEKKLPSRTGSESGFIRPADSLLMRQR